MGAEIQSLQTMLGRFPAERGSLIPILQSVQAHEGYISLPTVSEIAQTLRLTESQVYGVASFYAQFRFTPPGRHRFHVCLGTACHVRGGQALLDTLELRLGIREGQTTPDRKFEINRVACLGCCALAPVVKVGDRIHAQVSVLKLRELVEEHDES